MNDDVPRETRGREPHLEGLVRLDQQQLVVLARRAHAVQPHVARTPRVVHAHVDKGSGIIRPREAVPGVHHGLVDDAARRLLHDPRVALIPARVPRPRNQAPIRGRVQVRQAEKLLPARPLVLIDEELLAPRGHARSGDERDRRPGLVALHRRAVMRRVGLPLRETPEIPELALADRNRHVGERRGGLDLLHEAHRRLTRRRRHRVRPRVLRLQMSPDLGVLAVAQPIPRVIKMLPELVAHPVPVTLRGNRGNVRRGLGCVVRGRLSHGDHLRGARWVLTLGWCGGASSSRLLCDRPRRVDSYACERMRWYYCPIMTGSARRGSRAGLNISGGVRWSPSLLRLLMIRFPFSARGEWKYIMRSLLAQSFVKLDTIACRDTPFRIELFGAGRMLHLMTSFREPLSKK